MFGEKGCRLHQVHRGLVHDPHLETVGGCPHRGPLRIPLREHRHSTCRLQSQGGQASGRSTSHERLQASRHVQELLLQVVELRPSTRRSHIANPLHVNVHSYTYDLTSTLQHNLTRSGLGPARQWSINDRFAWNHHLLTTAFGSASFPSTKSHWLVPLIHGHVDQASMLRS